MKHYGLTQQQLHLIDKICDISIDITAANMNQYIQFNPLAISDEVYANFRNDYGYLTYILNNLKDPYGDGNIRDRYVFGYQRAIVDNINSKFSCTNDTILPACRDIATLLGIEYSYRPSQKQYCKIIISESDDEWCTSSIYMDTVKRACRMFGDICEDAGVPTMPIVVESAQNKHMFQRQGYFIKDEVGYTNIVNHGLSTIPSAKPNWISKLPAASPVESYAYAIGLTKSHLLLLSDICDEVLRAELAALRDSLTPCEYGRWWLKPISFRYFNEIPHKKIYRMLKLLREDIVPRQTSRYSKYHLIIREFVYMKFGGYNLSPTNECISIAKYKIIESRQYYVLIDSDRQQMIERILDDITARFTRALERMAIREGGWDALDDIQNRLLEID